jgi:uncharacterized membrane protein YagU involved in acid resistance
LAIRPVEEGSGERAVETPVRALAKGAAAGLAAALVLSALSRVLPGVWNERSDELSPPDNPEGRQGGNDQTEGSQSPDAFQLAPTGNTGERRGEPPAATPAGALTQQQAPGPEGLAEQFAFKVASGLFASDISPYVRPVGMATHLAYGSLWGILYGMLQASYRLRPRVFGPLYGMLVYEVGPAFLVPAMKLMRPPREEPPARTAMLIFGHVVYGAVVAGVFDALQRRKP